jgi:hypothetical protein
MSNTIRIKRRASGSPGAPSALYNAELAYNEVDDTLYYGKGTGGAGGTATSVEAIGGKGSVVMLNGDQSVSGVKTFTSSPIVPTPVSSDNSTKVATTEFVKSQSYVVNAGAGLTKTGTTIDVVGTNNRIAVNVDSIDIASTYVGQTSITTLGTITTGTWNANAIDVAYGGTGVASLTGIVKGNGTGAFSAAVDGSDYLSPNATIDGGTF